MQEILSKSSQPILFRFFSTAFVLFNNDYLPFLSELELALGKENIELVPYLSYSEYMAKMERGDFCIDAYHFGGSNSMLDGLFLRKPSVTWEGSYWYNRIGAQVLKLLDLDELIATSSQEYINLILKLIDDNDYRLGIHEKLKNLDL